MPASPLWPTANGRRPQSWSPISTASAVFSKENFSNGCIRHRRTSPILRRRSFLQFNPQLLKGQLIPILEYASLPRWRFPFAPHDLGTYPLANGQVYGGREQSEENQMPVEESGNMLLMTAALAKKDGNADSPENIGPCSRAGRTTCARKASTRRTSSAPDDFAGHLAHNTNLSLKAILAIGGYAMLCEMAGLKSDAVAFRKSAEDMAARWQQMADDGDHYRLTFDKPGSWSQKYNLVWDPAAGFESVSPAGCAAGDSLLQNQAQQVRPAARYPAGITPSWTGNCGRRRWRTILRTSQALIAPILQMGERIPRPSAFDRLVLDRGRQETGIPGALGRRRHLYQVVG